MAFIDPNYWKPTVEIGVIFLLIWLVLRFLQGTRGEGILKGLSSAIVISMLSLMLLSKLLELPRLDYLLNEILRTSVIALVIIFHPELRRGLSRLGETNPFVSLFIKSDINVRQELLEALLDLSKMKVGALIALQREIGLGTIIEGGTRLDADVRAELLKTIFFPGTTLHDGAVVIHEKRIVAAGCLFPLTDNPTISKGLGTRHRAAIGLSEETDAIALVVSEETGNISAAMGGNLFYDLDRAAVDRLLEEHYQLDTVKEEDVE